MLPFYSTITLNFGISNKKIASYDTAENSKWRLLTLHNESLSTLLTQNSKCLFLVHIPSLFINWWKIWISYKRRSHKSLNQAKILSRKCFQKLWFYLTLAGFIKAISCSEKTHVSMFPPIYASFWYLMKENSTKLDFFSIVFVFCSNLLGWLNFKKNQLNHTNLHNKILYNNGKILGLDIWHTRHIWKRRWNSVRNLVIQAVIQNI